MLVVTQASYISILPLVPAIFSILSLVHMLAVSKFSCVTILPMVLEASLVGPLHQRPIITPLPNFHLVLKVKSGKLLLNTVVGFPSRFQWG